MGSRSSIEWTDSSWNPIRGCSRISPGCLNCYAEKVAARFSNEGAPFHLFASRKPKPHWTGKVGPGEEHWDDPVHWRKPRRIFVNSMSDLFHEGLSITDVERVFRVMLSAPHHTYQILTKRADVMAFRVPVVMNRIFGCHWKMPNFIWLGVSVEDQQRADERIPLLLQTPAAIRFVSAEPLLGPVDLSKWLIGNNPNDTIRTGILGASGYRSILDRQQRPDMETQATDSRESAGNSSVLEGPRSGNTGGEVSFRWVPDRDVFGRDKEAQSICASRGLDVHGATGYSSRLAGEPQGREAQQLSSFESGVSDSRRERNPRDSNSGPEGQGAIRRGKFRGQGDGATGHGNSLFGRENVSVENSSEIPDQAGNRVRDYSAQELGSPSLNWVIVGGESGPGARPFNLRWARSTIRQCAAAGVACFVKQLGARPGTPSCADFECTHPDCSISWLRLKDRKGGVMAEWPAELRVRQFPGLYDANTAVRQAREILAAEGRV